MRFKLWRSAKDGKYVTKQYADENPDTTVSEAVEIVGYKEPEHRKLVLWYPLGKP